MRLPAILVLTSLMVAPGRSPQDGQTSVIWIYDCSQSHQSVLAPPYPERFGITTKPVDELIKEMAENLGNSIDVRILSFGSGLRLSPAWMRTRNELSAALDCGDTLNGPSPIWDAVVRSVGVLEERTGPRAILMVTDGKASANEHSFQEAIEKSKQAGVRVNIGLARTELFRTSRPPVTLNANRPGDPAERLKKLADGTNGRYAELSVWDLPGFFAEVARSWQK
jgi:hypothetical protein